MPPSTHRPRPPRVAVADRNVVFRRGGLLQVILSHRPAQAAKVLDCSEGGLRLQVSEPLEVDGEIDFTMEASCMPAPVLLKGRVLRCLPRQEPGGAAGYEVGLQITKHRGAYDAMLKRLRKGS